MHIWLLEPYYTGSHKAWADGLITSSAHAIKLFQLPGRFWKWRMHGAALELANQCNQYWRAYKQLPDGILISDMMNSAVFSALLDPELRAVPTAMYFHENQLTYPYNQRDSDTKRTRDFHYGFMNFESVLASRHAFFNSHSQMTAFFEDLEALLERMPDFPCKASLTAAMTKSSVLPLGLHLKQLDAYRTQHENHIPLILWSHRWEYDKNPQPFFQALFRLADEHVPFEVALLGARSKRYPEVFDRAKERLGDRIVAFGKPGSYETYADWLWRADILPVTSMHETFGISVMEAAYCNTALILPNRLCYPELYALPDNRDWFYEDDDLYASLRQSLSDWSDKGHKQKKASARKLAKAYDWSSIIQQYDDALCSVFRSPFPETGR